MVLLRARAQGKAERGRKEPGIKIREEGQVGAVRHGRWTTYGNNIEGDGNKMLCCLIQEKEHRGAMSGGADAGENLNSSSTFKSKERKTHKKVCARTLIKDPSTLRKILGPI